MSEEIKEELIRRLKTFINDYNRAKIETIFAQYTENKLTEDELNYFNDKSNRDAHYDEIKMQLGWFDDGVAGDNGDDADEGDDEKELFGGGSETGSARSSSRSSGRSSGRSSSRSSVRALEEEEVLDPQIAAKKNLEDMLGEFLEHEENMVMLESVVDSLEAAKTTRKNLEKCQQIQSQLKAEIERLKRSSTSATASVQPTLRTSGQSTLRPLRTSGQPTLTSTLSTSVPSKAIGSSRFSIKNSAGQDVTQRLVDEEMEALGIKETAKAISGRTVSVSSKTGRTVSTRTRCVTRDENECVIDGEKSPCYWVPENNPPCVTGTEYKKLSKPSAALTAPTARTPVQTSSMSSSTMGRFLASSQTGNFLSGSDKNTGKNVQNVQALQALQGRPKLKNNDEKKKYIMDLVGGRLNGVIFNKYLRATYGESRTISNLTSDMYDQVIQLTQDEVYDILELYSQAN
jgi:hypothetical protein